MDGKYILTASYKDKGGDQVGSLTSRQTIALRYSMMKADEFDESEKVFCSINILFLWVVC